MVCVCPSSNKRNIINLYATCSKRQEVINRVIHSFFETSSKFSILRAFHTYTTKTLLLYDIGMETLQLLAVACKVFPSSFYEPWS